MANIQHPTAAHVNLASQVLPARMPLFNMYTAVLQYGGPGLDRTLEPFEFL